VACLGGSPDLLWPILGRAPFFPLPFPGQQPPNSGQSFAAVLGFAFALSMLTGVVFGGCAGLV